MCQIMTLEQFKRYKMQPDETVKAIETDRLFVCVGGCTQCNQVNCILCQKPTSGSVGAAGMRWPNLCQPCKDSEDRALEANIKLIAHQSDLLQDMLFGRKK